MAEPSNQIAFEQIGLGGVLKRYKLSVPPNQREYSWTKEEVTTLLQDVAKAISDNARSYFLGTVVTIQRAEGELEVVDGQQRLATTVILLTAIRDALIEPDKDIAESIEKDFILGFDRRKRETIPRLRLNLVDNDYFKARVSRGTGQPAPSRSSHELIEDAFHQARQQVRAIVGVLNPKDHADVLNKWVDFLEHYALVVLLRVPNDSDAYKMFETLNDRGLKTSQSDLVKNYLFGRSGDRNQEVQEKWAAMRGALEAIGGDDITINFLRHALITLKGFVRESQVYDAVQGIAKAEQSAVTLATNLEVMANVYVAIHNPEHEKWNTYPDTARRAIETMNLLDIRPLRPLTLAVATKFSELEATKALQLFISWGVRLLIAGSTRSGSVEEPLAAAAQKVQAAQISSTAELKKEVSKTIPGDDQFRSAFETATVSKATLARYYLRSLEMAAKNESEPWLIPNDDRQAINLEHILPKKPMGNWNQFDEESVRFYANRIGNLALLRARNNSDLRSDDFPTKKPIYAASPYVLTSQVATALDWTPTEIGNRQKTLAGYALKAWPI